LNLSLLLLKPRLRLMPRPRQSQRRWIPQRIRRRSMR
jgi:hypothetical protein